MILSFLFDIVEFDVIIAKVAELFVQDETRLVCLLLIQNSLFSGILFECEAFDCLLISV